jgi:hypothetical protein
LAGRKQHYIPQSVQRAFEARHTGLKTQVYVYPKGRAPYLTSTEGAAAERDFYSTPQPNSKNTLDDLITDFESDELNQSLNELRSVEHGPVDPAMASLVIAHLTLRTAHLRGTFDSVFQSVFDQMASAVDKTESVRKLVGIDSPSDNRLKEAIRSELSAVGLDALTQDDRNTIERMISFRLRERFDALFENTKDAVKGGLAQMMSQAPHTVANTHKRVLSESLVSSVRYQALLKLQWQVVAADTSDRRFMLPDCVAIGKTAVADDFLPLAMLGSEDIATVVMPVSPQRLLVGGSRPVPQETLNCAFAGCSLKFFISSRQDGDMDKAAPHIGAFAASMNLDLFEDAFEPNPEPMTRGQFDARLKIRAPSGKSGDAMKRAIAAVVRETVDAPVLSTIESVTVTTNIRVAMESELKRVPNDQELRIAAAGLVLPIKNGTRWQSRIIFPRRIAESLLPNEMSAKQRLGRRVMKVNLGRAVYLGCWARQYPAIFEQQQPTLWRHTLYAIAFNAASQYAGALATHEEVKAVPLDGEAQNELASNITAALSQLLLVRSGFTSHHNVDNLTVDAAGPLDTLLGSVAALAGFAAAEGGALNDYPLVVTVLEAANLFDWAMLFAKDLARHYEYRTRWSSVADLDQLAEHVERILWTIGVSATPIGELYKIHVSDEGGLVLIGRILSH